MDGQWQKQLEYGFVYQTDQRCVNQSHAWHNPFESDTEFSVLDLIVNPKFCFNNVEHCEQGQQEKVVPCTDIKAFQFTYLL